MKNAISVLGRDAFLSLLASTNQKLHQEQMEQVGRAGKSAGGGEKSTGGAEWSSDELALLIKAVNLFPAGKKKGNFKLIAFTNYNIFPGTNQRWEVVASFINQHTKTPEVQRKAKETLSKAKELQNSDFHNSSLKEEANKKAYENLEKQKKRDVQVSIVLYLQMQSSTGCPIMWCPFFQPLNTGLPPKLELWVFGMP